MEINSSYAAALQNVLNIAKDFNKSIKETIIILYDLAKKRNDSEMANAYKQLGEHYVL